MSIGQIIQNVATGSAVFLGVTYIIGGMIVNLNLTRRGIVEYQILKVKYLAVGTIFLFQFIGVAVLTSVPALILFLYVRDLLLIEMISIFSVLGSLVLLYVWSRYPPNTKSIVGTWKFSVALSSVAMLFPLIILYYQFTPHRDVMWVFIDVLAILVGTLAVLAQIYHYSTFYYGRPAGMGAMDPIGMGIPTRVNLLCEEKISPALAELGLPIRQNNVICDVYLIDETDVHYIIGKTQIPGEDENNETYKIDKSLVKVILHKPDHMRKLSGGTGDKRRKHKETKA